MESLSNPIELVRKPQPHNARTRRIAAEVPHESSNGTNDNGEARKSNGELERVAAASESPFLPAVIWLAVETAMRRGEIIDLLWDNIDLENRVAHLPETKNGSARDVPLSSRAVAVLQRLQKALRKSEEARPRTTPRQSPARSSPSTPMPSHALSSGRSPAPERLTSRNAKTHRKRRTSGS